jgi:hypothetical protein
MTAMINMHAEGASFCGSTARRGMTSRHARRAWSGSLWFVHQGRATADAEVALPDIGANVLWGFAENDLWVGGEFGRLAHYDGNTWSSSQADSAACGPVKGHWGSGGTLFAYTESEVKTVQGGTERSVLRFPCGGPETVLGLWGRSPSEAFILVQDTRLGSDSCGDLKVLRFDGTATSPY